MIWAQENDKRADTCGVGEGPRMLLLGRFCSAVDHTQTHRQTCIQKAQGELSTTFILKFIGYIVFIFFELKTHKNARVGLFLFFVFFHLDVHSCSPHHNFPPKVCRKKRMSQKNSVMATSGGMDMQPENKNTFLNNKYSKIKTHLPLSRYRPKKK